MVTKSLYPDNFITVMTSDVSMRVEDKDKNVIAAYNLKWLANQLIAGVKVGRGECAMAGAAILHFLVMNKEVDKMQATNKRLEENLIEISKKLQASEGIEYADGVYEAYTLDSDENEVAQAEAAAKHFGCKVAQLLVINNMDFCDRRLSYDPMNSGECVHVADGYSLFKLKVGEVDTLISEDGIGIFLKRSDYNVLMKGYQRPFWEVVTPATNVHGLLNRGETVRIQCWDKSGVETEDTTHNPIIEVVQGDRVQGYFFDKGHSGREIKYSFDVKHDGKSFVTQCASVGCPRTRFYFKDWFLQQGD